MLVDAKAAGRLNPFATLSTYHIPMSETFSSQINKETSGVQRRHLSSVRMLMRGVVGSVCGLALIISLYFIWLEVRVQARPKTPTIALEYTVDTGQTRYLSGRASWHLMGRFHVIKSDLVFPPVSRTWFRRDLLAGIAEGEPTALYIGARAYERGAGVAQDISRSRTLLLQAAQAGHLAAQDRLGQAYLRGVHGFGRDSAEADKWLSLAAENGHARAAYTLSKALKFGDRGLAKDCLRALRVAESALPFFEKQAPFSHRRPSAFFDIAYNMAAIRVTDCQSLKARPEEAMMWYRRSVQMGKLPEVAELVAGLYALEPRYQDPEKAKQWSDVARKMREDPYARINLPE